MKNLIIVTARLFLGFFIIYIFPWSLSKNWRASRDENELDNHAATKTDPDSFRHFLIHCRRCKWMFTGWQVMSLVVDNTDRRNLTPADSPASQQPYTATTHRPVAHTVSWQDAKSSPPTPTETRPGTPESHWFECALTSFPPSTWGDSLRCDLMSTALKGKCNLFKHPNTPLPRYRHSSQLSVLLWKSNDPQAWDNAP